MSVNQSEKTIKGVIFADYVRMIKSRKDISWDGYLLPEDKPYFEQRISESEWYPFKTLERMSVAIVKEIAREDMEVIKSWGKASLDRLSELNQSLVSANQPMESLMRFKVLRGSLFNFEPVKLVQVSEEHARLEMNYGMAELAEKSAAYHTLGYIERLLELSGASQIDYKMKGKAWEGDPATTLEVTWGEGSDVKKVRGILFLDYVRMIKKRSDIDWSKYLSAEDMVYLRRHIYENEWYPFDVYERMGIGIIKEIAGEDYETVRQWGRLASKSLVKSYKSLLSMNDPMESLMRFHILRGSYFDFDPIYIRNLSPFFAKFEINYGLSHIAEKAATYQALGYIEMFLKLSGAENVKYRFIKKCWEGAPYTILEVSWDMET